MAGCYAGKHEIFSGNKKSQKKTRELLERVGDDQRAKYFLWPIPGQMTVKFIPLLWQEDTTVLLSMELTHRESDVFMWKTVTLSVHPNSHRKEHGAKFTPAQVQKKYSFVSVFCAESLLLDYIGRWIC